MVREIYFLLMNQNVKLLPDLKKIKNIFKKILQDVQLTENNQRLGHNSNCSKENVFTKTAHR